MEYSYTYHWTKKSIERKDITLVEIDQAIHQSPVIRDRRWDDLLNAIAQIPTTGRTLKVVYRRKGNVYKIVTAYWLD